MNSGPGCSAMARHFLIFIKKGLEWETGSTFSLLFCVLEKGTMTSVSVGSVQPF